MLNYFYKQLDWNSREKHCFLPLDRSCNNPELYFCNLRVIFHQFLNDVSSSLTLVVKQTFSRRSKWTFPSVSVGNYAKITTEKKYFDCLPKGSFDRLPQRKDTFRPNDLSVPHRNSQIWFNITQGIIWSSLEDSKLHI